MIIFIVATLIRVMNINYEYPYINQAAFFQVDQREKNKERTERELKSQHPLLSRIKPWLKRQLKRADEDHSSQHIWDAHIKAIGKECFPSIYIFYK